MHAEHDKFDGRLWENRPSIVWPWEIRPYDDDLLKSLSHTGGTTKKIKPKKWESDKNNCICENCLESIQYDINRQKNANKLNEAFRHNLTLDYIQVERARRNTRKS